MKNFVVLVLLIVSLLVGSGCASIHKGIRPSGHHFYSFGSPPLGGGFKSSTTLNIINSTQDLLLEVFWDGEEISSGPISPGKMLTYYNMAAFRGEQVSLNVMVWDKTHSRMVEDIKTVTLVMGYYWGSLHNTWTFIGSEYGGVQNRVYGRSFLGSGFRGGGGYGRFGY